MTTQPELIRHSLHPQAVMPQPFLGQSTPGQPHNHNLNLLSGAAPGMNFMPNTHSSNGPFSNPAMARMRADQRQREIQIQTQRATAGGAQTGPPVMNGVVPPQASGVGYPGIAPQNGQGPVHRVVSQPVGVGASLPTSHPNPHQGNINNAGLALTSGLQTQRTGPQSQPQPPMGIRPGQPSLAGQPNVGQIRPPPGITSMPPGAGMRSSGGMGMGVNIPSGIIGNVPQQTQSQPVFSRAMGMGGPGAQPPPQGPQGPAASMPHSMHRTISTSEGTSPFGAMPGFASGPFPQTGPHPPANHMARPNSANQPFNFIPPSSSPSQHTDMGHNGSSGGAGPSSTSPTRSDFTPTPAQVASSQYGSGGSGTNEPFSQQQFTTMPPQRPTSSSHSTLLAHQQAPTPQSLSHPTPPRQQTPLQPPQLSQGHQPDRTNPPIANPARPPSQPQRPSSQQRMGQPGTLPPNATLLQGHPASMSGGSAVPPQSRPMSRPIVGPGVGTGPPPLTSASSTENGDLSRQPSVPGIRQSMPRFVCS
jgi:hypothetical protein